MSKFTQRSGKNKRHFHILHTSLSIHQNNKLKHITDNTLNDNDWPRNWISCRMVKKSQFIIHWTTRFVYLKKTTTTSYKELFHTNHANMIHASGGGGVGGVCPPQLSKHCYVLSRILRIAQTDIIKTGVCLFH